MAASFSAAAASPSFGRRSFDPPALEERRGRQQVLAHLPLTCWEKGHFALQMDYYDAIGIVAALF